MNPFSNGFEKVWTAIMFFLYILIMIPFPWYYNTEYDPLYLGIPNYIFGWIIHAVVVVVALFVWRNQCMKRPEYQDDQLEREDV